MSDLAVLMKQHTQIGEGLAALQMLTSHLPDAVMVSSTKDHNLCFGDADGEAIGWHTTTAWSPTAAAAPVRMPKAMRRHLHKTS